MTRKKEKEKKSTEKIEKNSNPVSVLKGVEPDTIIEDKTEEIKQIEGKEQLQLEYFSKDELLGKIKELEENLKEREASLKKLLEENDRSKEKFMHLQAEFENSHKRWDRDRKNLKIQYTGDVLKRFLPLHDSFKKAVDSDPENETLKQFFNQFLNIFKSHKAEPIEVKVNDLFDYNFHEALTSLERDDLPKNSIIDVVQEGWKLGKDILRYAKVVISKKPKPPEPEPEPESEKKKPEPKSEEKEPDIPEEKKGKKEESSSRDESKSDDIDKKSEKKQE